jgi:hypothetical protein
LLTCSLRAQDKKLNVEIYSWKLCIHNLKSLKIYIFNATFIF